jgi:hypothetical protein
MYECLMAARRALGDLGAGPQVVGNVVTGELGSYMSYKVIALKPRPENMLISLSVTVNPLGIQQKIVITVGSRWPSLALPVGLERTYRPRCQQVASQLLDALERMIAPELASPVAVFSYPGRTQADAGALFAGHAKDLASQGYRPTAQSWGEGRPGWGRVFAVGELSTAIRPKGFLTVTYERRSEVSVAPVATPTAANLPQAVEDARSRTEQRLATLERLHSRGAITDEEFALRRTRILDEI